MSSGIITRGLGNNQTLVTRGFGSTLFIIIDDTQPIRGGGGGYRVEDYERILLTQKIQVPQRKKNILVDVVLLNSRDFINVDLEEIRIIGGYSETKIVANIDEIIEE